MMASAGRVHVSAASEAQVRAIVREEIGVALGLVMIGDLGNLAAYVAGSVTANDSAQLIDLALKLGNEAQQPVEQCLLGDDTPIRACQVSSEDITHIALEFLCSTGFFRKREVSDSQGSRHEISLSLDGLDNQSVRERPGPAGEAGPGRAKPQGGAL
ncbi:hypothetical protein [Mycolicibacterium wolinskyi]|uniref:hypothetical protein n=1 Tax=Mycolicibacterium wolinskyi TaxID=59750 RepID=UPI00391772F1